MSITLTQRMTYADFARLPEGPLYQLVDGFLVMEPSPTVGHQRVQSRLGTAMILFCGEHNAGEVLYAPMDVHLTDIEIYQPDILFVSNERSDIVAERIHGAPDLVVEILSPSTAYYDLQHKRHIYAESGVREYWIVDPEEQSIAVYSNNNGVFLKLCEARGGDEVWSDVLRGFRVEIETLFG